MEHRERVILENLIEVYKEETVLWDQSSSLYFNKEARNKAYMRLLRIYQQIKQHATVQDVKKKVENLRSTYKKELKKVKESLGTGRGANEEYLPKLWYFDKMHFLDESNVRREGSGTMEEIIIEEIKIKNKAYSDRNKKKRAYEELVKKYKEVDAMANRETVTKKINSLRTVYTKELRKIKASETLGTGEEDVYKPSLWYFSLFDFLNYQDLARMPQESIHDDKESCFDDTQQEIEQENSMGLEIMKYDPGECDAPISTSDEQASHQTNPPINTNSIPKKKKKASEVANTSNFSRSMYSSDDDMSTPPKKKPTAFRRIREVSSIANQPTEGIFIAREATNQPEPEQHECDVFAKHIAKQLKKLHPHSCILAQGEIQCILTKYRLADLRTEGSDLPSPSAPNI